MGLEGTRVLFPCTQAWAEEYFCTEAGRPPIRMKSLLYGPGVRCPDDAGVRVRELCLENLGRLAVHQSVPPVSWTASPYIRLIQCPERGRPLLLPKNPRLLGTQLKEQHCNM